MCFMSSSSFICAKITAENINILYRRSIEMLMLYSAFQTMGTNHLLLDFVSSWIRNERQTLTRAFINTVVIIHVIGGESIAE